VSVATLLRKVIGRLREKPEYMHLHVFRYDLATFEVPAVHEQAMARVSRRLGLTLSEITAANEAELDEITTIDEWKIGKDWSLRCMAEGWRCYTAVHDGRIVAITWAIVGGRIRDDYLERELVLAPDEAYYNRAFTVPAFRGKGVMPLLVLHAIRDLAKNAGAKKGLTVTRATNRVMHNTVFSMGGDRVGVMGFIGLFGARLHYIRGRDAFRSTPSRLYLDLRRFSKRTGGFVAAG
jgi:GNAT superfamily N-acetyltransferase